MSRRVLVVDDSATIRKLVRVILEEAGFVVEVAADGVEGFDRVQRAPYDLALIDFVMPRLNGFQLAQAIRSVPALRELPVVLMSAKAAQIGSRFLATTGAVASLVKPFPPDVLVDTVRRACEIASAASEQAADDFMDQTRPDSLRAPAPPATLPALQLPEAARDPEGGSGARGLPRPPAAPGSTPGTRLPPSPAVAAQDEALQGLSGLLAGMMVPVVEEFVRTRAAITPEAVAATIRHFVSGASLVAVAREMRALDQSLRGDVALEGLLGSVSLAGIVQVLQMQSQSGILVIAAGERDVQVALRDGHVDLAVGRNVGAEFQLSRYLIADGVMLRKDLQGHLASATGDGVALGETLLRAGYVSAEQLEHALTRQTGELVYEALRWTSGRFHFEVGAILPETSLARLNLPSETMVLEGIRRLDEWRLITPYIPSDQTVLTRDETLVAAMAAERLDHEERRVLDLVDGVRTVRRVADEASLSSFDTCKILYRLLRSRLVAPMIG